MALLPGLVKWTLEQKEVRCRLSNKDFHSLRLRWLQPQVGAQNANNRDQHKVLSGTRSQGNQLPSNGQANHISIRGEVKYLLSRTDTLEVWYLCPQ